MQNLTDRSDPSFSFDRDGLLLALERLSAASAGLPDLPDHLPEAGLGERATLDLLAPWVVGRARDLGSPAGLDHMDPPTPWVSWAVALWNAALNQNLLHPDVAPAARDLEALAMAWLAPAFGMGGGHMVPGSTLANLTALWAAREIKKVRRVVHSSAAHLSVPKAAHLLGLEAVAVSLLPDGRMDDGQLPADLSDAALVLTAGTTNHGAVDPLDLAGRAAWTHVDAAWAGPLRLSDRYRDRLAGIDRADSVAVSAHKWLFQPKESAFVLFKDYKTAEPAISFGGSYLATPNVGLLGSHGAVAVPLLATLLAWGREGVAARIDRTMATAEQVHGWLGARSDVEMFAAPVTGVFMWRPKKTDPDALRAALPFGLCSATRIGGEIWLRQVAANPMAEADLIQSHIANALETTPAG